MRPAILGAVLAAAAFAQTSFEAASVRPVPDKGYPAGGFMRGGPGTKDPGQITFQHATVSVMVMEAYGVQSYQVFGPSSIEAERYDVVAKVPQGTTKQQAMVMIQNLLAERFKLKLHHETKIFPVYELTVAKSGLKMRVSPEDANPIADYSQVKYVDDMPQFPPGSIAGPVMAGSGMGVMTAGAHQPISTLIKFLQSRLALPGQVKPVVDKTGLTGYYDYAIKFVPPVVGLSAQPAGNPADNVSDPGLDAFAAVEKYLGLRLEEKKDPIDVLVIDSVDPGLEGPRPCAGCAE